MKKFKAVSNRDIFSPTQKIKKGELVLINMYPKKGLCDISTEDGRCITQCPISYFKKI